MSSPAEDHNAVIRRVFVELGLAAKGDSARLNVIVESLLLGAAKYCFPGQPRKQAICIQEIADGAIDRVIDANG